MTQNKLPSAYICTNLDFEYQLAQGISYQQSKHYIQRNHAWRYILRLLPEYRQAEAITFPAQHSTKKPIPRTIPEEHVGLPLIAWGNTQHMEMLAKSNGLLCQSASIEDIARLNDKTTSHLWEKELDCALPYSKLVSNLDELLEAIQECPFDWLAKHPQGVSGRERIMGEVGQLHPRHNRWLEKRFKEGWSLVFEPLVDDLHEYSVQYVLQPPREGEPRSSRIQFVGSCELFADRGGVFRGHKVVPGFSAPKEILEVTQCAVEKIAETSYFGPVGFDTFTGSLGTESVLRPITEINTRYTFGYMALALSDIVPKGWSYLWWHPSFKRAKQLQSENNSPLSELTPDLQHAQLCKLPSWLDPEGKTNTWVIVAKEKDELNQLIRDFLEEKDKVL